MRYYPPRNAVYTLRVRLVPVVHELPQDISIYDHVYKDAEQLWASWLNSSWPPPLHPDWIAESLRPAGLQELVS